MAASAANNVRCPKVNEWIDFLRELLHGSIIKAVDNGLLCLQLLFSVMRVWETWTGSLSPYCPLGRIAEGLSRQVTAKK